MSDYTPVTNFTAKNSLPSGAALKVLNGVEFTTEFTAIQTAVNSKLDAADGTATGTLSCVNLSVSGTFSGATTIDGGTY
tara:strand:+ start:2476 stop:2712 length:237 start_codon:yes stop_codon:yes gene_type:complete